MSDEIFREISLKIDRLILLIATNSIKGLRPNDAIQVLGEIGLDRNLRSRLVGTTPATVSVRLSEAKARKAKSAQKPKPKKKKKL